MEQRLKCSHGTVMNRKRALEKKLGPLDQFRNLGPLIEDMQRALRETRAKEIFRKGLVEG